MEVTHANMKTPIYCAIAARLLYSLLQTEIPDTIEEQADYWNKHYNSEAGKGSRDKFISDVKALEERERKASKAQIDLVMVLDHSASIGEEDFQKSRRFVSDVIGA